jgi:hypothetical protein
MRQGFLLQKRPGDSKPVVGALESFLSDRIIDRLSFSDNVQLLTKANQPCRGRKRQLRHVLEQRKRGGGEGGVVCTGVPIRTMAQS